MFLQFYFLKMYFPPAYDGAAEYDAPGGALYIR